MLAGTEVLWEEKLSYYDLMVMKVTEGEASFNSEEQNEPINRKTVFQEKVYKCCSNFQVRYNRLKALIGCNFVRCNCNIPMGARDETILCLRHDCVLLFFKPSSVISFSPWDMNLDLLIDKSFGVIHAIPDSV